VPDVSLPPALLFQGWLAPRLDERADEGVVKQLSQDDMLALAAYVGSLPPPNSDISSATPNGAPSTGLSEGFDGQKTTNQTK
jgi:hypothetical protein